jgi:acylphosphatase
MQQKIRRYNITLRDHVQLLGYRGQIELIGKDLGLHGIVFNAPDGSVKVVAEGEESVIDVFFDDLKRIREGVDIETLEYMKRFDKGIDLLTDIKSDNREFLRNTNLLVNGQDKLVEGQNQMNNGQNKVIALLEKIESKFK